MSDEEPKLIAIDEKANHQIVHGDRFGKANGTTYKPFNPGPQIDAFVSQWVLKALEPAALTLSLEATARVEQERHALDQLWRQRVERAAYEAERAARHYRLVEPENRLVARQLAQDWEEKLTAQRQVQEDYQRFVHAQPRCFRRVSVTPSRSWRRTSRPCGMPRRPR